jgi:arylsulfatase A-like enzyme
VASKRCAIITTVLWGGAALSLPAAHAQSADRPAHRPNIVVILADDLGYAGMSCQGCKDIPTPHIDSLAAAGVRCTSGYVSCPVCSPTRAGLMTGRYQQRFGHEFNPGPAQQAGVDFGLPLDQKTIADYLKTAGYTTGITGKWHLGFEEAYNPLHRGFDEYFGFLGGAHKYLNPSAPPGAPILRGLKPVDEKEYLTDAFTREAVAFIDRHAKEPFFLYLPYNAVHAPLQTPEKYLDRFKNIEDPKRRKHAAMVSAMDDGVGAVIEKLQATGLEDNTLIFFLSDNGGPTPSTSRISCAGRGICLRGRSTTGRSSAWTFCRPRWRPRVPKGPPTWTGRTLCPTWRARRTAHRTRSSSGASVSRRPSARVTGNC